MCVEHEAELEGMVPPLAGMLGSLGSVVEGGQDKEAASRHLDVLNAHLVLLPLPPVGASFWVV